MMWYRKIVPWEQSNCRFVYVGSKKSILNISWTIILASLMWPCLKKLQVIVHTQFGFATYVLLDLDVFESSL